MELVFISLLFHINYPMPINILSWRIPISNKTTKEFLLDYVGIQIAFLNIGKRKSSLERTWLWLNLQVLCIVFSISILTRRDGNFSCCLNYRKLIEVKTEMRWTYVGTFKICIFFTVALVLTSLFSWSALFLKNNAN